MCQKSRRWRIVLVVAGLLALLVRPPVAPAVNRTYIAGPGTASWHLAANWSPSGAPLTGDNAALTPVDSFTRTVVYAGTGSFLFTYGAITIDNAVGTGSITVQNGTAGMLGTGLNIGPRGKYFLGTTAFANFSTVGISGGTLEGASSDFPAAHSQFFADDYNHVAGLLKNGSFTIGHSYMLKGGTISSGGGGATTIVNNGTFDYIAGGAVTGAMTNNGTLIYSGSGSLNLELTNNGTIIFNSPAALGGLTNNVSMTLPAGATLFSHTVLQDAGAFTQLGGTVSTGIARAQNATLDIREGNFAVGLIGAGVTNSDGTILLGNASLGNVNPGQVDCLVLVGGTNSVGSFLQSGGTTSLNSGLSIGTATGGGGLYRIDGGVMTAANLFIGAATSNFASYVQTGGTVTVGSLVIDSPLNGASMSISGGKLQVTSNPLPAINKGLIVQTGGVSQFFNIDGTGSVTMSGGSMTCTSLRQSSAQFAGTGRILVATTPAPPNNRVQALTFDETGGSVHGTFDIGEVPLIIDYSRALLMPVMRRYIASGYAAGNWNGTGLRSSAAALDDQHRTGLGYAEASDIFGAFGGVFENEDVDGTSVLVKYTLYGDSNLDGTVDTVDFNPLAANFGGAGKFWNQGDFNYDGAVDTIDFNLLASNFGQTLAGPIPGVSVGTLIPEPSLIWLGIVAPILRMRRRKDFRGIVMPRLSLP